MVTAVKRKARMFTESLGSNEWGNELMWQVANERFAADPTLDVVEVHEHGGWYLSYNRDGLIVDTANDTCRMSSKVYEWWSNFAGVEYAGSRRRN